MEYMMYCPKCGQNSVLQEWHTTHNANDLSEGETGVIQCQNCGQEFVMVTIWVPKPEDYHPVYCHLNKCKDQSWRELFLREARSGMVTTAPTDL